MKTQFSLKNSTKNEDFFKLIERILSSNWELHKLKDSFKSAKNKYELTLSEGYYELLVTGQNDYVFFSLSKRFEGREYIVHLVFENLKDQRNLYMELECIGGAMELNRIPPFMLDVTRCIASCKDINQAGLGKSGELIIASEENRIELISCINNYSYDIPMVLATEYDNSHAYEINENELARRLSGFAYVVVADKAFIDSIKKEINAKLYNGTVVVYHKGEYKLLRKENKLFGASLDEFVFQHIREHSQSIILPQKTNEAVSDSKEIEELKKQLIKEKEKNARLSMELNEAKNENKALAEALENAKNNEFAIIKPKELYEGEIIDLIHSVCAEAKKSLNPIQKRKIDLIDEMLALNPRAENGKMFFNKFKGIFYNGVDLKGSDFAKLEKQGFKCERERGHYIFIYDKYRFVTAKSTSDDKSGKNLYSDFRSILCVY